LAGASAGRPMAATGKEPQPLAPCSRQALRTERCLEEAGCKCFFCQTERAAAGAAGVSSGSNGELSVLLAQDAAKAGPLGARAGPLAVDVEYLPGRVALLCIAVALYTFVVNARQLGLVRVYSIIEAIFDDAHFDAVAMRKSGSPSVRRYLQSDESPVAALYHGFQAMFALLAVLLEINPRWLRRRSLRMQDRLYEQAGFLTRRRGRGFFYLLQATLSLYQFKSYDCFCGMGLMVCAVLCSCTCCVRYRKPR